MRSPSRFAMMLAAAVLLADGLAAHRVSADRSVDVGASEFSFAPAYIDWGGGEGWATHVRPRAATLWYDAGASRLLYRDDIPETYYHNGKATCNTRHTVDLLTSASSLPAAAAAASRSDAYPPAIGGPGGALPYGVAPAVDGGSGK